MAQWGVYGLQGRDARGATVAANDRSAVRWFVRWRVDETLRKRTFRAKGYAKTFREKLLRAQVMGWEADGHGWPLDPADSRPGTRAEAASSPRRRGQSFEEYCERTWWPIVGPTFADKNRLGHRANMRTAIALLTYGQGDLRVGGRPGAEPGASLLLVDLVADDLRRALTQRASINLRTRAVNARRIESASRAGTSSVDAAREQASRATVRAFYVTLAMIVNAAMRSGHVHGDPLAGVAALVPRETGVRLTERIVPSIDEIFDLSEAIAGLGPVQGGRRTGERFRSLVLAGGTLGPRPGELVAHRPEWITWGEPTLVGFAATEAPVYDAESGRGGLRERPLKHRREGESRSVPAMAEVADALRSHLESGFDGHGRTWTSPSGRGRLNWGNLTDVYWRPACQRVFSGSSKDALARMSPKTLRKAAITFWLDAGISPFLAAEWAGHSEEVSRRHYAGRASASYAQEIASLGSHAGR